MEDMQDHATDARKKKGANLFSPEAFIACNTRAVYPENVRHSGNWRARAC